VWNIIFTLPEVKVGANMTRRFVRLFPEQRTSGQKVVQSLHVEAAVVETREVLNGTIFNNLWVTENESRFRERVSTSTFLSVALLSCWFSEKEEVSKISRGESW
jgi:hypothetical protein